MLQKSLQKFYTRTLGGRDYTVFEAMFLGLRLPLVNSLVPMDSLNTTGSRVLKTRMLESKPDSEIAWSSKVDKFDDRLGAVRRQYARSNRDSDLQDWEDKIRDMSLYEFYSKYSWK